MRLSSGYLKTALGACVIFFTILAAQSAHAVHTATGVQISNFATAKYDDENTNTFQTQSNTVKVTVTSIYLASADCTTASQAVPSHTNAVYACWVKNIGNAPKAFTLSATSTNVAWTTSLWNDNNQNGTFDSGETTVISSTGSIVAEDTYRFFLAVAVPQNTPNKDQVTATITVGGSDDGDKTIIRVTTASAPLLSVEKKVRNTLGGAFADKDVTAKPGETLEYQIKVTNSGDMKATNVTLEDALDTHVTFSSGSMWAGDGTTYNGGTNNHNLNDAVGDNDGLCGDNSCAAGVFAAGKVNYFIGKGARDNVGGSMDKDSFIYLYYRVTVN